MGPPRPRPGEEAPAKKKKKRRKEAAAEPKAERSGAATRRQPERERQGQLAERRRGAARRGRRGGGEEARGRRRSRKEGAQAGQSGKGGQGGQGAAARGLLPGAAPEGAAARGLLPGAAPEGSVAAPAAAAAAEPGARGGVQLAVHAGGAEVPVAGEAHVRPREAGGAGAAEARRLRAREADLRPREAGRRGLWPGEASRRSARADDNGRGESSARADPSLLLAPRGGRTETSRCGSARDPEATPTRPQAGGPRSGRPCTTRASRSHGAATPGGDGAPLCNEPCAPGLPPALARRRQLQPGAAADAAQAPPALGECSARALSAGASPVGACAEGCPEVPKGFAEVQRPAALSWHARGERGPAGPAGPAPDARPRGCVGSPLYIRGGRGWAPDPGVGDTGGRGPAAWRRRPRQGRTAPCGCCGTSWRSPRGPRPGALGSRGPGDAGASGSAAAAAGAAGPGRCPAGGRAPGPAGGPPRGEVLPGPPAVALPAALRRAGAALPPVARALQGALEWPWNAPRQHPDPPGHLSYGKCAVELVGLRKGEDPASAQPSFYGTAVTLCPGVETIPPYAFQACSMLASVELPDSLTAIGEFAFEQTGLVDVTVPDGVTSIGMFAFFNAADLVSVVLPSSLTTIGLWAFVGTGLVEVTIPGSVTSIGNDAFDIATLTTVYLPGHDAEEAAGFAAAFGDADPTIQVATGTETSTSRAIFVVDQHLAGAHHHGDQQEAEEHFTGTRGRLRRGQELRGAAGRSGLGDPVVGTPTMVMVDVQTVSASQGLSGEFTVFLTTDGAVRSLGSNEVGQLGDGTFEEKGSLVTVFDAGVQAVSAGDGFFASLLQDGSVMAAGQNTNGQLGDGTTVTSSSPQRSHIDDVSAISAGWWHLVFLKTDGTAHATGKGESLNAGALGDGGAADRATPVQVLSVTDVRAVAAGKSHTLLLRQNGEVWGTGQNWNGELGLGSTESPVLSPLKNTIMSGVQAIAAGVGCSFFVKADGTAWATGSNANGKLGDGTTQSRSSPVQVLDGVQSVSSQNDHTLFVKADGTAYAAGENLYGQLGTGRYGLTHEPGRTVMEKVISAVAGPYHSFFLTNGSISYNFAAPCPAGTSVGAVDGVEVTLETWIPHQGERSIRCPDGSLGSLDVKCWAGRITVVQDSCAATTTVAGCDAGEVASAAGIEVVLTAPLQHQGLKAVGCSGGYVGAAVVECSEGSLRVAENHCAAAATAAPTPAAAAGCAPGQAASAGGAATAGLPEPLPDGGLAVVPCGGGRAGGAAVECSAGSLRVLVERCGAAPAATAAPTPAPTEAGQSAADAHVEVALAAPLPHGALGVAACPEGTVGGAVVRCSEGELELVQSHCAAAPAPAPTPPDCQVGQAASGVQANMFNVNATLVAPLPQGKMRIVNCTAGWVGLAVVECMQGGTHEVVENRCSYPASAPTPTPAACEPGVVAPPSFGSASGAAVASESLTSPLEHGGLVVVDCSDGYVGSVVVECSQGGLRVLLHNCRPTPPRPVRPRPRPRRPPAAGRAPAPPRRRGSSSPSRPRWRTGRCGPCPAPTATPARPC
ncbi:unnamed protein product [Prorocentrum cordatum]|uniref:RCC1-like domain-containing protein n=1 Tax=Prorocentrum cordatum TaxID=2364126 RepID=A0ABN9V839_9DINO|nr:unnamed protein product [Polarella glacialis]